MDGGTYINRESRISRRRLLRNGGVGLGVLALAPHRRLLAQDPCSVREELTRNWGRIKPRLATRYHRLNHLLFHYLRNNWAQLPNDKKVEIANLDLGWGILRPALYIAGWDQGDRGMFWAVDNGSGEDFLYYHRWMIAQIDGWLGEYGPLQSWSGDSIPAALGGCADEKVPDFVPVFEHPENDVIPSLQTRVREVKSDGFYWSKMAWWGQEFRDRGYLQTLTLGQLGSRLEKGVHNQMHIRWSDYPSNPDNPQRRVRWETDIDPKWDHPDYDTLFDEYSSHVHPTFFRLHKWLDNRINDWAEAHGNEVERYSDERGFQWFRPGPWVDVANPWVGANGFTPERPGRVRQMEDLVDIIKRPSLQALEGQPAAAPRLISLRNMI